MKLTFISLLAALSIRPILGAAKNQRRLRKAKRNVESASSIECFVSEIDGISPPDEDDLVTKLMCEDIDTGHNYLIDGDTDAIFEGMDHSHGHLKLTVPTSEINGMRITFDEDNTSIIDMRYDKRRLEEQRRLQSTGQKSVLIVMLTDSSETDSTKRVWQSAAQMSSDVFADENNLAKRYELCSNGQLTFVPSSYGVKIFNQASSQFCGKNWWYAADDLNVNKNDYGADFIMYVMPDCVDWEGAAGWGQTPGHLTWYPSQYASYPVVQVHEMGHNLGHMHSGKNGVSYGDDTGYMGNKADWNDYGTKMCFNAAKLWYFNWFPNLHKSITVSEQEYHAKMIGIGQTAYAVGGQDKLVLRVKKEKSTPHLFILFNSISGEANNGVKGDKNMVVITSQLSQYSESTWETALANGEEYTYWNWGISNEHLVIKNCGRDGNTIDRATVVVAVYGSALLSCDFEDAEVPDDSGNQDEDIETEQPPVDVVMPQSVDMTQYFTGQSGIKEVPGEPSVDPNQSHFAQICENVPGWHDSDGQDFNCFWYENNLHECNKDHPHDGHTARTACCGCGGGNAINLYNDDCQNTENWEDKFGKNCAWYERDVNHCYLGNRYSNMGQTANEACCYCKQRGIFDE